MKTTISTIGKFHAFDLATELYRRSIDCSLYTGYPNFKTNELGIPRSKIHSVPWIHTPYMALSARKLIPNHLTQPIEYIDRRCFDKIVSLQLQETDIFHGMSSACLISGKKAKELGAKFILDRGSSHIKTQQKILRQEFKYWGIKHDEIDHAEIDERIVELEQMEYQFADRIFTPSTFSMRSFTEEGVTPEKISVVQYGVDTTHFYPTGKPLPDQFTILFVGAMSLRKGIPYLLSAFSKFRHKKKRLLLAGQTSNTLINILRNRGVWDDSVEVMGHQSTTQLRNLMSTANVLVLPSVEDGFGLVMAQAMACGCPVIATTSSGGPDLIQPGHNGFLVPPRNSDAILHAFEEIAESPSLQRTLSANALTYVQNIGGWSQYGDTVETIYQELLN